MLTYYNAPSVYLAGPIGGCDYGTAVDWREDAKAVFEHAGIAAYSPMRGKEYLNEEKSIAVSYETGMASMLSNMKAISCRDHFDCSKCSVILVNFLEATKVSIGTVLEIGMAYAYRKPIILAAPDNHIHKHGMLDTYVNYHVNDLDTAYKVVKSILIPSFSQEEFIRG